MAPTPVEDIHFPDLSDDILDILCALWTFVSNLCIVLWSYISQAFWAVWTYPPFETFRNEFVAVLIVLMDYVVAHPITATTIAVLVLVVVPEVLNMVQQFCLHRSGFRRQGVLHGTFAANYQSTSYGGNVPRGSTFAHLQSQGSKGGYHRYVVSGTGSPSWN